MSSRGNIEGLKVYTYLAVYYHIFGHSPPSMHSGTGADRARWSAAVAWAATHHYSPPPGSAPLGDTHTLSAAERKSIQHIYTWSINANVHLIPGQYNILCTVGLVDKC